MSNADQLRSRTKSFSVRILRFVRTLPHEPSATTVARQLARSGTGISSNFYSACRARSRKEFIARLAVATDEADETVHWLELLADAALASGAELAALCQEAGELRAIFVASLKTAKQNFERQGS